MSEIVERNSTVAAQASDAAALMNIIERAALNPAIDIDKMERLLQMKERILSQEAEQAFNAAMSAAQGEMDRISADANNPQTKSKYASYGQIDKHLRPIYTRHGFALSFGTDSAPREDYIRITCAVSHAGGFTRHYHVDMPADGKGAKGGDVMTKTHAVGAAMSYGSRYLLKLIFNVAIGESDNDGNDDDLPISQEQWNWLTTLVEKTGADLPRFLAYMDAPSLKEIRARDYQKAVKALEAKQRARGQ